MVSLKNAFLRMLPVLQMILTMVWLSNLSATDAYFSVYVIIAFFSFSVQMLSIRERSFRCVQENPLLFVLSVFFSLAVILANYPLFTTIGDPALIGTSTSIMVNLINTVLSLLGGICTAYPVLQYLFTRFPLKCGYLLYGCKGKWIPFAVFFSFLLINLIHLFLVEYPGNITEDPFTQISEMVSGSYSNFNTFWHTMFFQAVLSLGYGLFSDFNAAIATFCVLQVVVLAFAFTYCLDTMLKWGVPKYFLIASYIMFAFLPYHIALSITVWKDVLFAAGCVLLLSSWLRILKCPGNKPILHYFVFICGSLLFLMARANGWIIYLISFLFAFIFSGTNKKLIAVMGCLAVFGWFMLNPALSLLGIPSGDRVESLSIPIQQVSRVIADGHSLSEEDEVLLSKVMDLEEVPALYTNWLSDPMKEEIRSKDLAYFGNHLSDYAKLWVRLGIQHPWEYLKAWIDQTRGYWNGGYDYFLYSETIVDNPYGVEKSVGSNPIASLFRLYFGLSRHVIFFEPLHSIGLHVWILFLCFIMNVAKKHDHYIVSLPLLILVIGLWFGTPVYASFRYVYPLFASFPLILSTTIYSSEV